MKLALFTLLILGQFAFAEEFFCTKWGRQQNLACVMAGRNADVWYRQCENPCTIYNYGPKCDLERMCSDVDPNELGQSCTPWKRESMSSCANPATGRWEQKWVRSCQVGLATSWCSDEDPNQHL